MKKTLDPVDLKLIELLSENARRSLVALAKGLGLSRSATQERLERLQTSGVICALRSTAAIIWFSAWFFTCAACSGSFAFCNSLAVLCWID